MSLRKRIGQITKSDIGRNIYSLYFIPWMTATSYRPVGKNIFEDEWDLAIILDACRVDALKEVAYEYTFINNIDSTLSIGSSSKEWMVNTFREEYGNEINNTVYLTGNAWADVVLMDEVSFSSWSIMKDTVFDSNRLIEKLLHRPTVTHDDFEDVIIQSLTDMNGIQAFCAEELTDFTIHTGRTYDADRVVAHYMQPHEPYVHRVSEGKEPTEKDMRPIDLLRKGHDREAIWEAYLNNLRYVLDEVERLLENFEGDVLITADHGEMLGEYNLHGHGEGIPHPHLKRVPWIRTRGIDKYSDQVDVSLNGVASDDVQERLSALGYT